MRKRLSLQIEVGPYPVRNRFRPRPPDWTEAVNTLIKANLAYLAAQGLLQEHLDIQADARGEDWGRRPRRATGSRGRRPRRLRGRAWRPPRPSRPATKQTSEGAELRSMLDRAQLGNYLLASIDQRAPTGVEAELNQHFELPGNMMPIDMFAEQRGGHPRAGRRQRQPARRSHAPLRRRRCCLVGRRHAHRPGRRPALARTDESAYGRRPTHGLRRLWRSPLAPSPPTRSFRSAFRPPTFGSTPMRSASVPLESFAEGRAQWRPLGGVRLEGHRLRLLRTSAALLPPRTAPPGRTTVTASATPTSTDVTLRPSRKSRLSSASPPSRHAAQHVPW